MNKIFKKSLALTVSAALCLTAFIGCLSVSAEEPVASSATITVKDTTIAPGATGDVDVEFANVGDICATLSTITFPEGFVINSIKDNAEKQLFKVLDETDGGNVIINKNVLKFCEIINFAGQISTTNVILTINVTAPETAGTYTVKVGESSANYDEKKLAITTKEGTVTVASSHVHDYEVVAATPAIGDFNTATEISKGSVTLRCKDGDDEHVEQVSYTADAGIDYYAADYSSQINLVFSADKEYLGTDYTDAFAYFTHVISSDNSTQETIMDISKAADTVVGEYPSKSWYYGIKSTQLTENVTAYLFYRVGGVWYCGYEAECSVRTYADEIFPKLTGDRGETEKALIANMLTYGSKMQTFKKYNTDNLADANFDLYKSYVTTSDPTISAEIVDNQPDDGAWIYQFQLDMASKIEQSFSLSAENYTGTNKSDLKVVVEWNNANGVPFSYTYDKTGTLDGKLNPVEGYEYDYEFKFSGLVSYDLRQQFTIKILDGDNVINGEYVASVEACVAFGIANGTYGNDEVAVYKAMMNYSDAARAHFVK